MANPQPRIVQLERQIEALSIEWTDGHHSRLPFRYLRGFCPCAVCQGHARSQRTFVPVDGVQVARLEEAGSYALQIYFDDGHDTGIYSYDALRELCPCQSCQRAIGPAHAVHDLPPGEIPP